MSTRTLALTDTVLAWLVATTVRETPAQARLREETASHPWARMQIAPEQGQLMTLLVELTGARRAIEVGTFTGYSALCIARGLPPDGKLLACDVSEEFTRLAREAWERAGVAHRIELVLGPASVTLEERLREGGAGQWDFAFIDADKPAYDRYYELCLELLRPGGLIAIDNALWSGRVADPDANDEDTVALRALCSKVASDSRVTSALVPIGDGLLLARKR